MDTVIVECLRCGTQRQARYNIWRHVESAECPRCSYVGWAQAVELTEPARKALRERPLAARRLRAVG